MKQLTISGFDYEISEDYIGFNWYVDDAKQIRKGVIDDKDYWEVRPDYFKITATNDPELIKQGVPELTPAESTIGKGCPFDEVAFNPSITSQNEVKVVEISDHNKNHHDRLANIQEEIKLFMNLDSEVIKGQLHVSTIAGIIKYSPSENSIMGDVYRLINHYGYKLAKWGLENKINEMNQERKFYGKL